MEYPRIPGPILGWLAGFLAIAPLTHAQSVRVIQLSEGQAFHMGKVTSTRVVQPAVGAKRLTFAGATPPNELVASIRAISDELAAKAPAYLHPSAQLKLLHTAADCLAVLELAVLVGLPAHEEVILAHEGRVEHLVHQVVDDL